MILLERFIVKLDPEQTVIVAGVALITGAGLTTTSTVLAALVQPPTIAVTE